MERPSHILIIDDDARTRMMLKMYLENEGCIVSEAADDFTGLQQAFATDIDLVVLEMTIPLMRGFNLHEYLYCLKPASVLILTSRSELTDKCMGFEAGADDYVTKPFSPRELVHRVLAILNRTRGLHHPSQRLEGSSSLILPDLIFEPKAWKVSARGQQLQLTPKEYELLYYLSMQAGKAISRRQLLQKVWKLTPFKDHRTIDTHIKRLRDKLNAAAPSLGDHIVTIRGQGYCWSLSPQYQEHSVNMTASI
ncbi:response regulator transcription factor [Paenibacillus sp. SYP-B4298]|uniref:response regulator transcription factor n=1 Tax=Paenibacillus sp. SYP-B4298 TaxID=2996034 RepID=UPI0022DDCC73|nr:response regulator transcription factor [Paenibacillus sp. SYP-B4298]